MRIRTNHAEPENVLYVREPGRGSRKVTCCPCERCANRLILCEIVGGRQDGQLVAHWETEDDELIDQDREDILSTGPEVADDLSDLSEFEGVEGGWGWDE